MLKLNSACCRVPFVELIVIEMTKDVFAFNINIM